MPGINSLLNVGKNALFAEQAAIHVTGNNIANVNTAGYSRQAVRFDTNGYIDYNPGQIGLGVRAAEVIRYFDEFIERSYVQKNSSASRYETQYGMLLHVEGLFNESNSQGTSALLSSFMNAFADLAPRADSIPTREALLSSGQSLANAIHQQYQYMRNLETRTDDLIRQDVDNANLLMEKIADLNKQIKQHHEPGYNNANTLLDERDQLIRELSRHYRREPPGQGRRRLHHHDRGRPYSGGRHHCLQAGVQRPAGRHIPDRRKHQYTSNPQFLGCQL